MTSLSSPPSARPVAARVLQQLVGLGKPQGALPAAQPVVEDDGGDLAALAAAGAVAQHPAPAEAQRAGQRLAVCGDERGVNLLIIAVLPATMDGLPAGADAVLRGQVACMGLAREHDALELGIRQQPVRDDPLRQEGTVCRHGMGHGRHGRGLHQRRRMLDGARNPDDARPPGRVGTGAVGGGIG